MSDPHADKPHVNENRQEVIYAQANESVRRLDEAMWQVPLVAMTLTGGLWYGIASLPALPHSTGRALLAFAGIVNLGLALVLARIRVVIDKHLRVIRAFEGDAVDKDVADLVPLGRLRIFMRWARIVRVLGVMLVSSATLCIIGAARFPQVFPHTEVSVSKSPLLRDSDRRVNENASAVAVRDRYPVSEGHTLVVPKRAVESPFDLTDAELLDCWHLMRQERDRLSNDLRPDGFNVGFNVGAAAGQTIEQAHFHLIPRRVGDNPDPAGGIRAVIPGKAHYGDAPPTR